MKTNRQIDRLHKTVSFFRCIALVALLSLGTTSTIFGQNPRNESASKETGRFLLQDSKPQAKSKQSALKKIVKTNAQWRRQLTSDEFQVTRMKGTENAYSGKYWDHKKDGVYVCKCCQHALFDSKQKYDSKTGWPSYTAPKDKQSVGYKSDTGNNMVRTEVICKRCDAHLGHVFNDGPQPTGMRYCMNSLALKFVPRKSWKSTQLQRKDATKADPAASSSNKMTAKETPAKLDKPGKTDK